GESCLVAQPAHDHGYVNDTARRRSCWLEKSAEAGEAVSQVLQMPSLQMSMPWFETWTIARHVLKKPGQADPTLSNLFDAAIWHKTSVVQIIDHSDVFRQWFT
ncbi:MAG: hypothetical protein ACKPKO_14690, partial [Candidatus Fonsibacter sp.]